MLAATSDQTPRLSMIGSILASLDDLWTRAPGLGYNWSYHLNTTFVEVLCANCSIGLRFDSGPNRKVIKMFENILKVISVADVHQGSFLETKQTV